jgi:hypothetical protein
MPISVACPTCSAKIKAPDRYAGRKVHCPKCTNRMTIPSVSGSSPEVLEEECAAMLRTDSSSSVAGSAPEWLEKAPPVPAGWTDHDAPNGSKWTTADHSEQQSDIADAGAGLARSAVQLDAASLKQTFGEAVKQTFSQMFAALGQVLRHPFRLSFVTVIFVLLATLGLGSFLGAVLFPVFVMGYITCIRATISGEPMRLEGFIGFMRHGWDSLWHLLMMLAAFFVTIAAMLAPFAVAALGLYLVFGSVGAAVGEFSSHSSGVTTSNRGTTNNDFHDRRGGSSTEGNSSGASQWISDGIGEIMSLGLKGMLMAIAVVILTPIAAALILFFYLVLEVSRGSANPANRFELVYDAFRKMLVVGWSQWKELLLSGLSLSVCLVGIVAGASLLRYLLLKLGLYVLAAWVFVGLVPAAMCFFVLYANVFVTMACLSLGERTAAE